MCGINACSFMLHAVWKRTYNKNQITVAEIVSRMPLSATNLFGQ